MANSLGMTVEDIKSKDKDGVTNKENLIQNDSNDFQNLQTHDSETTASTLQSNNTTQPTPDTMSKKKKLTPAEKLEAQALKEAEVQRKADEKLRREEAKRLKEEEKRVKDDERRQKQDDAKREKEEKQKLKDAVKAEKDAARAEKDAEKKARDEAQAKKDKAQLRLGAFFKKSTTDGDVSGPSSRRSSIASLDMDAMQIAGQDTETLPRQVSEYEKAFPPFFLHAHTSLASATTAPLNDAQIQSAMEEIKRGLQDANHRPQTVLGKRKRASYIAQPSVKKIMLEMQGSEPSNPIDLERNKLSNASDALKSLQVKVLKFREDVRPPWIGTYSKAPEQSRFAALCRNPFRRELPNVNYDYDSEAEWEEPEEGEDLNSEGEEDDEEEDEDMGEFLDDEAAEALPKRKQLVGDLEPVYTALNWEKPGARNTKTQYGVTTLDLDQYRMGILLETPITFPIDPFSTSYWANDTTSKAQSKSSATDGNMQPPVRIPLTTLAGPNQALPNIQSDHKGKLSKPSTTAKPIPPELLADFKKAISGSNLSKIGLIEVLKKDFPSITKKTVEQTLLQVAHRVGKKEADKTWQLIEGGSA